MKINLEEYQTSPYRKGRLKNLGNDVLNGIVGCGFFPKPSESFSQKDQAFPYYSGVLVLSGDGTYVDADGTEFPLYPGCYFQRIPGRKHASYIKGDGQWLEFYVAFGPQLFRLLTDIGALNSDRAVLHPGDHPFLLNIMQQLERKIFTCRQSELPGVLAQIQEFVFTLYSLDYENTLGNDSYSQRIDTACDILGRDLKGEMSLREVAAEVSLSFEHFRKLFKEKTSFSPIQYRLEKRMDAARVMLLSGVKTIPEIASELGYSDEFAFSKQFKSSTGCTPSAFRRSRGT